ncbi:hypothetical protein MRX96_032362 [Rhipicephalus microplus]
MMGRECFRKRSYASAVVRGLHPTSDFAMDNDHAQGSLHGGRPLAPAGAITPKHDWCACETPTVPSLPIAIPAATPAAALPLLPHMPQRTLGGVEAHASSFPDSDQSNIETVFSHSLFAMPAPFSHHGDLQPSGPAASAVGATTTKGMDPESEVAPATEPSQCLAAAGSWDVQDEVGGDCACVRGALKWLPSLSWHRRREFVECMNSSAVGAGKRWGQASTLITVVITRVGSPVIVPSNSQLQRSDSRTCHDSGSSC